MAVHNVSIWLDAVSPRLNDVHQTSVWFNIYCVSGISDVPQASAWFNAVYQASLWLNVHGSMLCIRHHY